MNDAQTLSYKFSLEELKALVMVLRPKQSNLPKELSAFVRTIQDKLYGALSIDDVERIYRYENC